MTLLESLVPVGCKPAPNIGGRWGRPMFSNGRPMAENSDVFFVKVGDERPDHLMVSDCCRPWRQVHYVFSSNRCRADEQLKTIRKDKQKY